MELSKNVVDSEKIEFAGACSSGEDAETNNLAEDADREEGKVLT